MGNFSMARARIVEYTFFFGILAATGYLMWNIIAPFFAALAIAAVVVTVSYPFYKRVLRRTPRRNASLAAMVTTFLVSLLVLTPLSLLGYLVFSETVALYNDLNQGGALSVEDSIGRVEALIQTVAPTVTIDLTEAAEQATGWISQHVGTIFAGTLSTVFLIFLAIIGIFYCFRDGEQWVRQLVRLSPLPDSEDTQILDRLSRSVRSVILGTLLVALIQGTLTAIGLSIFGIEQAVLWGAVAAIGALIPGIGTTIVFIPAVAFLGFEGSYGSAIGLTVWGLLAVGLIDNLLGPYLMSRGVTLHPFFILLAVLGGITVFGPIGFVLGPVAYSLFVVLLELYSVHMNADIQKGSL